MLIAALKDAGIRFAYCLARSPNVRCCSRCIGSSDCERGRASDALALLHVGSALHLFLWTCFQQPSTIASATWTTERCSIGAPLPAPKLPPLGHLLDVDDQHTWLVQRKFASWLARTR